MSDTAPAPASSASQLGSLNNGPKRKSAKPRKNDDREMCARIMKADSRMILVPGCPTCLHAKDGPAECIMAPTVNGGKCAKCVLNKTVCHWEANPKSVLMHPSDPTVAPVPAAEWLSIKSRRGRTQQPRKRSSALTPSPRTASSADQPAASSPVRPDGPMPAAPPLPSPKPADAQPPESADAQSPESADRSITRTVSVSPAAPAAPPTDSALGKRRRVATSKGQGDDEREEEEKPMALAFPNVTAEVLGGARALMHLRWGHEKSGWHRGSDSEGKEAVSLET